MYVCETVIAGPVIEKRKYFSSRYGGKKMMRAENHSATSLDQWKVNENRSIRNLYYLILENFKEEDIRLDLTYREPEPGQDEAVKELNNFLRRLKRRYTNAGHELKWIATTECKGHRIHHHLLLNNAGIDRKTMASIWPHAKIDYKSFRYYDGQPDDARRVAEYLVKETRETFCQPEAVQKHRYRSSANLKKPEIRKEVIKSKNWSEKPRPPKGYYIEQPIQYGYTAYGFPYQFYRMIRIKEEIKHERRVRNKEKPHRLSGHCRRPTEHHEH